MRVPLRQPKKSFMSFGIPGLPREMLAGHLSAATGSGAGDRQDACRGYMRVTSFRREEPASRQARESRHRNEVMRRRRQQAKR